MLTLLWNIVKNHIKTFLFLHVFFHIYNNCGSIWPIHSSGKKTIPDYFMQKHLS